MEKEQIIDYVMNTPGNTNAEVLRGMLNQLNNNGGGDCLPPITKYDIGKVLGVIKDGETEPVIREKIIAPLQTLNVVNAPVLISVDTDVLSALNNGATVYATINNKTLEGVYESGHIEWSDTIDNVTTYYQIFPQANDTYFIPYYDKTTPVEGNYAVKVFLEESVTYPIPKYDLVSPPYRFGPYVATTLEDITIWGDSLTSCSLNAVYLESDYSCSKRYAYPTEQNVEFYYLGHNLQETGAGLSCRGIRLPSYVFDENGQLVIEPAIMQINNTDVNNVVLSPTYASVTFYCSVKLEEYVEPNA